MKLSAKRQICLIFLILVLAIAFVLPAFRTGKRASAAVGTNARLFESMNVMDDLRDAQLNGQTFDLNVFNFDEAKETQVIAFMEFCYSFYSNIQDDYGLYVYVYNPKGLSFELTSSQNMISLRAGSDSAASFSKYHLKFLNCSQATNYEGLFYKFKVNLTSEQKEEILNTVNSSKREYRVGEIELQTQGDLNATSSTVGTSYYFSGYAEGYGPKGSAESTLEMTSEEKDVLSLKPHATWWRPEGTNGTRNARDTLHSVYFSVPNEAIQKYGEMVAVHATWLNALTCPILVTGNEKVYEAIGPYIATTVNGGEFQYANENVSPLKYALIAGAYNASADWNNASYGHAFVSYNANAYFTKSDRTITDLQYIFFAENKDANTYNLSAKTFVGDERTGQKGYFETYTRRFGGELVNNKFSRALFEEVEKDFTDVTIYKDDSYSLTDEIVSQDLWQKFVGGGYNVQGKNTYTISAIKRVDGDSFGSTKKETCRTLYIDQNDYDEFKSYYNEANANNETVYLFRFYQSEYIAYEAIEYERGEGDWTLLGTEFGYNFIDTNAYFYQTWVNLGFDIIDVTFSNGIKSTVIPVGMSPIDVIPGSDPPLFPTEDPSSAGRTIAQIIIAIVLLLLIGFLVYKLLEWAFTGGKGRKKEKKDE